MKAMEHSFQVVDRRRLHGGSRPDLMPEPEPTPSPGSYLLEKMRAYKIVLAQRGVTPSVKAVCRLVRDFYALPENGAGGNLHIVLDDGNVGFGSVEFCRREAAEAGDEVGTVLAELLLLMKESARHKVYSTWYKRTGGDDGTGGDEA